MVTSISVDAHHISLFPQVRIHEERNAIVQFKWEDQRYSGITLYFNSVGDIRQLIVNLNDALKTAEEIWQERKLVEVSGNNE